VQPWLLINGAWLSLMAFTLQGLNDHLSLLASLDDRREASPG
jgi:hypothetical protein